MFAKLDAVHGYFQLEKSSMLTTFLLLQGKLRYLRALMGLNALSEVKSFMELANQVTNCNPDIAHMGTSLGALTQKGMAWQWTYLQEVDFRRMKQLLSLSVIVKPFDQQLEKILLTDASRLKGLGFALMQRGKDGRNRLLHCDSKSLTQCQLRYSTIELKCLAIQWAVTKCDYYLRGLPTFDVLTDHRPLAGLFQKDLHTVDTPRLLRLREKLIAYSFKVTWVPGKTHLIVDALSRAPVFELEECQDLTIDTAVTCLKAEADPALTEIIAEIDHNNRLVTYAIKDGLEADELKAKHPAAQHKKIWGWL